MRMAPGLKHGDSMGYYSLAHSGTRQECAAIIYQQNPINMICQQGANNHISISESEAIQIGHGNTMLRQIACAQRGKRRGLAGTAVVPKLEEKVRKEYKASGLALLRSLEHTSPGIPLFSFCSMRSNLCV